MNIPYSLTEIRSEIERIGAWDTTQEPIEEIELAMSKLLEGVWTPCFDTVGESGFELWRARNGQWNNVKELWYPPSKFITKLGRMNQRNEPVFYSCFGHNAGLGSLEEIRANKGDIVTQLCCSLPQQSPKLRFVSLGHADTWMEKRVQEPYKEQFGLNRAHRYSCVETKEEFDKNEIIKDWVNSLFVKRVSEGLEHQYSHTIAISHSYFKGFGCDGILFPSVASDEKAVNLVLSADTADRYVLPKSARIVEVLDIFPHGYQLKLKNESEVINSDGSILWKW